MQGDNVSAVTGIQLGEDDEEAGEQEAAADD
jgi:hypothetical protein